MFPDGLGNVTKVGLVPLTVANSINLNMGTIQCTYTCNTVQCIVLSHSVRDRFLAQGDSKSRTEVHEPCSLGDYTTLQTPGVAVAYTSLSIVSNSVTFGE